MQYLFTKSILVLCVLLSACNGGGGSTSTPPPPPANVSMSSVSVANNATNVAVDSKPAVSFTVANGSYLSNTLALSCGGNAIATTQAVDSVMTSGTTTYTITFTPSTKLPYQQVCQLQGQINASPAGGTTGSVSVSFTTVREPLPPKLIMTGTQTRIIDLTTGATKDVALDSSQCRSAFNPITRKVHFVCTTGSYPNYVSHHPILDPVTGEWDANTAMLTPQSGGYPSVACAVTGKCYYFFYDANQSISDARMVVVQNGVVSTTIKLSDPANNRYQRYPRIIGSKLWLAEIGADGSSYRIVRLDLATMQVEITIPLSTYPYDISINEQIVAIANRNEISLFDASNGASLGQIDGPRFPPGFMPPPLRPFPPAIQGHILAAGNSYLNGYDGFLRSYALNTKAKLAEAFVGDVRYDGIGFSNSRLYVATDKLYELDPNTLKISRVFDIPAFLNKGFLIVEAP